jgi:hypothetical protein
MNQAPPPPPPPTRDRHREFMSHKPPSFSHSPDPLKADDWIKTVEKMLNIVQCTDREKVLYAPTPSPSRSSRTSSGSNTYPKV